MLASYSLAVEAGVFSDEDGDGVGKAGETVIYTTTVTNTGNVRVGSTKVSHLLEQGSVLVCDAGFEAATSTDVRAWSCSCFFPFLLTSFAVLDELISRRRSQSR